MTGPDLRAFGGVDVNRPGVHIAVGAPDAMHSAVWRFWTFQDEIYVGNVQMLRVSLALGADAAVDSLPDGLARRLSDANGGTAVDVVLESVGGPIVDASLEALARGGRLVAFGQAWPVQHRVPRHFEGPLDRCHRILVDAHHGGGGDDAVVAFGLA